MALDKEGIIEQITDVAEEASEVVSTFIERAKPVVINAVDKAAEKAAPVLERIADVAGLAFSRVVDFVEEKTGSDLDGDGFIGGVPASGDEVPVQRVDHTSDKGTVDE